MHASGTPPSFFFFCHSAGGTKKRDWIPLPPDHPIGHISGRGWSWRTIERSIPSHFASRFHWLFDFGAATRARGARSVDKGQLWGEFEANFGATPALGVIPSPHQPPAHRSRRITVAATAMAVASATAIAGQQTTINLSYRNGYVEDTTKMSAENRPIINIHS